jgi:gamma-glutamylcyclotransferase (GGCT)/AIG2-like uncharacterized protein YtfP
LKLHVFTYGSLMFPPIWQRIVLGSYRSARATVHGHVRRAVRGQTYPGMIGQPGSSVCGLVYFDVDADDIARLDAFEGLEYRRDTLDAALEDGGMISAAAYIYIDRSGLSDAPWEPDQFRVERFIAAHCRPGSGQS